MSLGILLLYKEFETAVSFESESPDSFSVKVSFHQGSALSPFLLSL